MKMRGRLETELTEEYLDRTFGKRKKSMFSCFSADRIHAAAYNNYSRKNFKKLFHKNSATCAVPTP